LILGTFSGSFIIGIIEAGIIAAGRAGLWAPLIYGLIIVISVGLQICPIRKPK